MLQRKSFLRKIGVGLRHPEQLVHRLELILDLFSFRLRYSFLAKGAELADPSNKVLVVSLNDTIAQTKMEGILAKSLQVQGYTPVILTQWNSWAAKYFRVFGFTDLVFFDDFLREVPTEVTEEADAILGKPLSFASLHDLECRGVFVGKHVLSTVVRNLRNGSISFEDPNVLSMIHELLPHAFRCAWAAEALFDRVRPQLAMFSEKGYVGYAEIFDVAVNRGVASIQFTHSHRADALVPRRFTADTRNLHPFALSEQSWQRVKEMHWTPAQDAMILDELRSQYQSGTWFERKFGQVGKKAKTPEQIRVQLGLDPSKKTAVIFSHVLWDATFFYGENLFEDYERWLIETIKVACANTSVNWVVKVHPDYVWKMKQINDTSKPRDLVAMTEQFGELPDHVKILEPDTDISTYSVFGITDYGITVRGTVGIELSCLGIPVLTAGTGRYSGLGFTVDSATREDYLEKLRQIDQLPPMNPSQTELARRYAYAVFKLRPMEFNTFQVTGKPLDKLGGMLDQNMVIQAKSFEAILNAPDLRTFAEWAINSNDLDYLAPVAHRN